MTDAITESTATLNKEGVKLLNFWRLAETERGHVQAMLQTLALPYGAKIVDLGSGTGEFARIALTFRPDLQFTLVNIHEWQLDHSPTTVVQVLADMSDTGLASASYDAVLLAYALGHGDVVDVLEEAHRLMKPSGVLCLHDIFTDTAAVAQELKAALHYTGHSKAHTRLIAEIIGFDNTDVLEDTYLAPGETVQSVSPLLEKLSHGVMLFSKSDRAHAFKGRKVALQYSGGKDSMACMFLLKPFLPKYITVYWLNTGDGCPETVELVERVRGVVPNFVEITTDVKTWRAVNGTPSDIVPANAHYIGSYYGLSGPRLTNRFDCCAENIMRPMHERMIADGVDCVIRGTKKCDTGTVPAEGDTGPYHVVLPIKDWSHQDVFDFLASVDAPYNPLYDFYKGISAPECFGCTAWWEDGKSAYFKALHPERLGEYRANLQEIKAALQTHLADLDFELRS